MWRPLIDTVGIQAVPGLPLVRHPVVVRVFWWSGRFQLRPASDLILRVDDLSCVVSNLSDKALVDGVPPGECGAGRGENPFEGGFCGLGRHLCPSGDRMRRVPGDLFVSGEQAFLVCVVGSLQPVVVHERTGPPPPERFRLLTTSNVVAHIVEVAGRKSLGVINHVVAKVADVRADCGGAFRQVCIEVVVEACVFSSNDRAESVWSLVVRAVVQRFADHAPLNRVVGCCSNTRDGHGLVTRPAEGTVVDDDVARECLLGASCDPVACIDLQCVCLERLAEFRQPLADFVAGPEPQVPDDDLAGADAHAVIFQADAVTGCRLPGQRQKRLVDCYRGLEFDRPRHSEEYRPRSTRLDRLPEAPGDRGVRLRIVVVQCGHQQHAAVSPPRGVLGETLGTRKSRGLFESFLGGIFHDSCGGLSCRHGGHEHEGDDRCLLHPENCHGSLRFLVIRS